MNIILSTYLTKANEFKQHDSTNNGKGGCRPDNFSLIGDWYKSVLKLQIPAYIFHNELSADFIHRYTTNEIKFVKWDQSNRPSYNDERYYIFESFIQANPLIQNIIYTDIFDVVIHKNPFELITNNIDLVAGSEEAKTDRSYQWVNNKLSLLKLPTLKRPDIVYNAGIGGGKREPFLIFLRMMLEMFKDMNKEINANMGVFNTILHQKNFSYRVLTGFPLHNTFKSYKNNGAYIQHK